MSIIAVPNRVDALPCLGGRDVQRELKSPAETHNIPIVVVSDTDTRDRDTRDRDPRDFACALRKPVTPEALVAAVDDCLRRACHARS
jgi:DNA-binding response OmpR family regulator